MAAMMEADRTALCGPKGVPEAGRFAVRAGTVASAVVRGGRRAAVRRSRARDVDEAGVSMRCCARTVEPLPEPEQARSTSKSATSRRCLALSAQRLAEWLSRSMRELDLPAVTIDGIHFR